MQSGDFAFDVGWKGVFETMFSEKMKKIDDVVFFLSKKNENAKNGKKLVNPFRRPQKQSWNLQIMILYHFLMWLNNRKIILRRYQFFIIWQLSKVQYLPVFRGAKKL